LSVSSYTPITHSLSPIQANKRVTALTVTCAIALLIVAFFSVRPTGASGPAMRDFEAFYAAGAAANAGADPYSRSIWRFERAIPGVDGSHDETLPFVGPPAVLPLWRVLALLPYGLAGRSWGAVLACAMLVMVFGTLTLARAPHEASIVLGATIFAASFGALISDVSLGQVALLSAAAIVATLLLLRSRAWPAAAITTVVGAFQPNMCLVLIARLGDMRASIAFAIGAVVFFGLMFAFGGIDATGRYLHLLAVHGAAERHTVIQITPASVALGWGASDAASTAVRLLSALAALGLGTVAMRRTREPIARVGFAACMLPFVVPFFHEHDFVLLVLPALYCALRARGSTLALAAVASVSCSIDWLGLAQRVGAQPQSLMLALAATLGIALLARLRRETSLALLVPAALIAVCLLARTHPVPIWPDALPLHWHGPPGASVSALWELEQRTAGLEAQDPVWSFLRLLPLFSDALLGFALYRTLMDVDVHEISERLEQVRVETV